VTTDVKNLTTTAQEQVLDAVKTVQSTVLGSAQTLSTAFEKLVPVKVPSVDALPFATLPTPAETVALTFDFTEKLLASQRQFLLALVAAAPTAATPAPAAPSKN
jgi:hypothetical protein